VQAADVLADALLEVGLPGHELRAEPVVDHREALGNEPQALALRPTLGFCFVSRWRSRAWYSQYVSPWATQKIHRLRRYDQRVRGIQAAGYADHHPLRSDRAQTLHKLECCMLRSTCSHRWAQTESVPPSERTLYSRRADSRRTEYAGMEFASSLIQAVVVKRAHGRALLPQEVQVNIGDRVLSVLPEALAFS
jgi:hypothetical protein